MSAQTCGDNTLRDRRMETTEDADEDDEDFSN